MTKLGRNAPCPCGSGRKYKHCCLAASEASDFQYRRLRQIESNLIPLLLAYAEEQFGPESVEEAWEEFNDWEPCEELDPDSPMNMLFKPWFLFNWTFELEGRPGSSIPIDTTIVEALLFDLENELTLDEKAYLDACVRPPFSLCEVVATSPGEGMTLRDLLRRVEYKVTERLASSSLQRGQIIYCASAEVFGVSFNVATSPYNLHPTAKRDVLELRRWMVDELGTDEIGGHHLYDFENDIRSLYLEIVEGMLAPPRLANTDGEPLLPHKLYFDIESADEAFNALKFLAEGVTESDLVMSVRSRDGVIESAEISWHGGNEKAKKRMGENVLLGVLRIDGQRLIVDVNSLNRAEEIRRLIEERLGEHVTYKTTLIEPLESEIEEMWNAALSEDAETFHIPEPTRLSLSRKGKRSSSEVPSSGKVFPGTEASVSREGSLEDFPEVQEMLKRVAQQHWQTWFDEPVPALNNMTPREAAKTDEGRELLESLLLYFEQQNSRLPDNASNPDIAALRRELGME